MDIYIPTFIFQFAKKENTHTLVFKRQHTLVPCRIAAKNKDIIFTTKLCMYERNLEI